MLQYKLGMPKRTFVCSLSISYYFFRCLLRTQAHAPAVSLVCYMVVQRQATCFEDHPKHQRHIYSFIRFSASNLHHLPPSRGVVLQVPLLPF